MSGNIHEMQRKVAVWLAMMLLAWLLTAVVIATAGPGIHFVYDGQPHVLRIGR